MVARKNTDRIAAWPRLTRFYGITPAELAKLPNVYLDVYIKQLPALQAEEQLLALQASDHPYISPQDRSNVHRNLVEMADIQTPAAPTVDLSTESGQRTLGGLGIGLVLDPKPQEEPDAVPAD